MVIKELGDTDGLSWDSFVAASEQGSLFHCSQWLRILEKNQKLRKVRLGFYEQGQLTAVLPLFVKSYGIVKVAASPFVSEDTPYLGLLVDDTRYGEALTALNGYLTAQRIGFLRMTEQYRAGTEAVDGVDFVVRHTHVLDLRRSEKEVWDGFEGRCRTAIRKAEKNGVNVSVASSGKFVDEYYSMLESLYARQKMVNPNPLTFYRDIWDSYHGKNSLFVKADVDGELAAAAIIICYRNRAYYINGASDGRFNSLCPSNAVQWFAIKQLRAMGIDFYDFVGSDIERLAKFKKSFGGALIQYRCVEIARSRYVSFLRKHYNGVKRFLGKLRLIVKRSKEQ